jgi:hypothetical protein
VPWKGIFSATAFAICSTYHTTLQKSPGQLVFGRDMIFNVEPIAHWEHLHASKQKIIQQNNQAENSTRIPHNYSVGDKVMLRQSSEPKYEQSYSGPHTILHVGKNGTVRLQVGLVIATVNLRHLETLQGSSQLHSWGGVQYASVHSEGQAQLVCVWCTDRQTKNITVIKITAEITAAL